MVFKKGISLIEIIVTMSLVGLVATLTASLYVANFRLFNNQNASIDIGIQNKIALDVIVAQVRESQGVSDTCCSGETSGAHNLVLKMWPIDATGEPIYPEVDANYDYVVFGLDPNVNENLVRKVVPSAVSSRRASNDVIAPFVTELEITYDDGTPSLASEVTVLITMEKATGSKTQHITESAVGVLRNK